MNNYALFEGSYYYPSQGWNDCRGVYSALELAQAAIDKDQEWGHIVDLLRGEIIMQWCDKDWGPGND